VFDDFLLLTFRGVLRQRQVALLALQAAIAKCRNAFCLLQDFHRYAKVRLAIPKAIFSPLKVAEQIPSQQG